MTAVRIALVLTLFATSMLHAQVVNDGAANTLSNVTNTITGDVTVGTNGSFTVLELSDNVSLVNSLRGLIGRNITAKSNEIRLTSPTARWQPGNTLYVGSNGGFNRPVISSVEPTSTGNRVGVDGGMLRVTNAADTGVLDVRRGTNVLSAGLIDVDRLILTNTAGRFELLGGTLVTRGASINNGSTMSVGQSGGGSAFWDVRRGSSNHFVADSVFIGNASSSNQLLVSGGARLTNNNLGLIGSSAGADGNSALVTGPGSRWEMPNELRLGTGGAFNRLTVGSGGRVASGAGRIGMSGTTSSDNLALVTGAGSVWSNTFNLFVGEAASGNQLQVDGGGLVVSDSGKVGQSATSSGNTATVTGSGSEWRVANTIEVGTSGSFNQALVSGGATVRDQNLHLGVNASSSNNLLHVTGGTLRVLHPGAVLDVRGGTNRIDAGLEDVLRLVVTNTRGQFELFGGTLRTPSTIISNGRVCVIGGGASLATFQMLGGTHTFDDNLTVATNGSLIGTGIVDGTVTVSPGGRLTPGAPIGNIDVLGSVILQGTVNLQIDKSGGVRTSDEVGADGAIFYNGTLNVTDIGADLLVAGDRFVLFDATPYVGAFTTLNLPPLAPGLSWANHLSVDGSIEVVSGSVSQPKFSNIIRSGTNLIFSGTDGAPGQNYAVLTATNVTTPGANWLSLVTNQFSAGGQFSFTNGINRNERQLYFRLRTP